MRASYEQWCASVPYWNPHSIALWCVLEAEGYVRHRRHLEALAVIVGWELDSGTVTGDDES